MSNERKFKAAVNVIRNLPKNGSYQPSHDLMLRFYAYYKQATEGPNTSMKPNFWEVVRKMKWDAWSKLGNMSREQAMISYVEELNKIVETMAYTDNVANFLTSLDSFYESVPAEDLELVMGPVIERVRSQPGSPLSGSPLASREASPHRAGTKTTKTNHITSSLETSPASSYSVSPSLPDTDEEEDYFLDTYEQTESENTKDNASTKKKNHENPHKSMNGSAINPISDSRERDRSRLREKNNANSKTRMKETTAYGGLIGNGVSSDYENASSSQALNEIPHQSDTSKPVEMSVTGVRSDDSHLDISEVVQKTLSSLRKDIESLNMKITAVEVNSQQIALQSRRTNVPVWWPLRGVSVPSAVFFIVWPLVVQAFVIWLQRRRRPQT